MDSKAMYKLTYGLFVLTSASGGTDNGCIINTAMQVTTTPNRISITVNKANKTHDMIKESGIFNVSVLSEEAVFEVFTHFGFKSGRDVDKFADWPDAARSENGLLYITKYTNAYLSGKVVQELDLGTHTMFIADVTAGEVLSGAESVTYSFYQSNIKPKPGQAAAPAPAAPQGAGDEAPAPEAISGPAKWVCRICGYVYEGEELPEDFVCPICKHGAIDFERMA